jgi:hypothetical protein
MKLATSDCALFGAIILMLAATYGQSLGLSASSADILGMAAGIFLILIVVLRRREAERMGPLPAEKAFLLALGTSRVGLVLGAIATFGFFAALCFDLFKP